jgi:hypothetical protein
MFGKFIQVGYQYGKPKIPTFFIHAPIVNPSILSNVKKAKM